MSDGFNLPEYVIAPEQYKFEAVSPLLEHHDLRLREISRPDMVLSAVVALGRTALARNDMVEYDGWRRYLTGLTAKYAKHDPEGARWTHAHLATLQFFGATSLNVAAANELGDMLHTDPEYVFDPVLNLCAQYDASPSAWISSLPSPQERVVAWHTYISRRNNSAEDRGMADPPLPGAGEYMQEFLLNDIPPATIIKCARTLYPLATDAAQKRLIAMHYCISVPKLQHLGVIEDTAAEDMADFAALLNCDPDMADVLKDDLYARVMAAIDEEAPFAQSLLMLDASRSIGKKPVLEVIQELQEAARLWSVPEGYWNMCDGLLASAASLYMSAGKALEAAIAISRILNTSNWHSAAFEYFRLGGAIDVLRSAEAIRRQSVGTGDEDDPIPWSSRADVIAFLDDLCELRFSSACLRVQKMAEASHGPHGFDEPSLWRAASWLLQRDPSSVTIGPAVIGALQPGEDFSPKFIRLYQLFTAYGSKEVAATYWQWVQRSDEGRAIYLSRYAAATLASAGGKERE